MKIEINIPDKITKHFDDVTNHVKLMNPDKLDITIESILIQSCKNTVISIYNEYLQKDD